MQEVFEKLIKKLEEKKLEHSVNGMQHEDSEVFLLEREEYGKFQGLKEAIEIVKQAAAENNNGWIPCSELLPETNESVLCWAKSTARGGDVCFVGSCHNGFWFLQSSADTHSFPGQYVIVAWHPLPWPYTKGE